MYRKRFHIPLRWKANSTFSGFTELLDIKYATSEAVQTIERIENLLKEMKYGNPLDVHMLHDYLHYLIEDFLLLRDKPFITESEVQTLTPQLFHFLNKDGRDRKPDLYIWGHHLVDLYVGSKEAEDAKKSYFRFGGVMKVLIVTPNTLHKLEVARLLSREDIAYIDSQFHLFKAEHQYWMSCLKLRKILVNEADNIDIKEVSVNDEEQRKAAARKEGWVERVEKIFEMHNQEMSSY